MGLFRKKTEIEKELSKLPRKERKLAELLLKNYEEGKFLRVGEDIDNKELMITGDKKEEPVKEEPKSNYKPLLDYREEENNG